MSVQQKSESKDKLEVSHRSPTVSELSATPPSSDIRRNHYFSTASDGRVTLTFPSSGARSTQHHGSSPQPARYDPATPASEFSIEESNKPSHDKTLPLRLMTDQSLATVLDSTDTKSRGHSNPGGNDLEAWIESARQTIIQSNNQEHNGEGDEKS